ncbi:MAG: zf-HC2 domain-containing protein [Burkholderiaceae bacterium]
MSLLLPDCQEVSRLLSDGRDQRLPPAERARLRLHLVICKTCRGVDEQFDFLRRAMQRLGHGQEQPPPAPNEKKPAN